MKPDAQQPDADRDAWLSYALRHAPDADMAAPPSLSEMILREAQAKAKPAAAAAPRPAAPFWSRVWDWMARPAVGAGVASVMLASLVGVMMWNRPLEEMSPRPSVDIPPVATAPMTTRAPAAADAASAPGAAAMPSAAPATEQVLAPKQAVPSTAPNAPTAPAANADLASRREGSSEKAKAGKPAEAVAGLLERKREALEQKRVAEGERRDEPSQSAAALRDDKQRSTLKASPDALAKAARTAESMSPAPPVVEAVQSGAAAPAAPPPMPAPVTAPAPAPAATAQPSQANAARAMGAASGQASPLSRQTAVAPVQAASHFAAAGLSTAPAERSFVNLRASLAAEPSPWTWSRDGAALHPIDDGIAAFLAEVDGVAASRWQTAGATLAEASDRRTAASANAAPARDKLAASSAPSSVRLLRNGQPVHILRLDGHVLHWDRLGAEPASATVTLSDAELQTVRRALDRLAP